MIIDKYTKFILTLIAVGILGLNFHLFNGSVVKDAYADSGIQKVAICDWKNSNNCATIRLKGVSSSGHIMIDD